MTPEDAAQELLDRRAARTSFTAYCEYRLPEGMKLALHHKLICAALDRVEKSEPGWDRVMIMMPPGSAKSTYGSVYFPEYFHGRNPQLNMIGGAHTSELAERFSRKVRNGIAEPAFQALFPNVRVSDQSSAVNRWETNQKGEHMAAGAGVGIAGFRADLIVIDDPVKNREDADSERMRQKVWDWWVDDIRPRLKPGGKVVIIMTRWHEDDLCGRLLDKERGQWKVIKLPMIAGEKDLIGRKPGEQLWPEWFTPRMVADAQQDARGWISLYQQEPRPADGSEFKRPWICRHGGPPRPHNKIILVDPAGDPQGAGGKRKKSDRTVMWVVALGPDDNAYVVDGVIDRMSLTQRADALFRLHRKHKPAQTRYEQYGMQADIAHMESEMERRQYYFKITPVGGAVEKRARIRRLIPWFEHGRMWLPHNLMYTTVKGEDVDIIADLVDNEYCTFPVGRFDDGMDCLARLEEPDLSLPWPDKPENDAPVHAGWQVLDDISGY